MYRRRLFEKKYIYHYNKITENVSTVNLWSINRDIHLHLEVILQQNFPHWTYVATCHSTTSSNGLQIMRDAGDNFFITADDSSAGAFSKIVFEKKYNIDFYKIGKKTSIYIDGSVILNGEITSYNPVYACRFMYNDYSSIENVYLEYYKT